MGLIIASWVYAAPRATKWQKDIKALLFVITGEEEKFCNEKNLAKAEKLYLLHRRLANTYPVEGDSCFVKIIKIIYVLLWLIVVIGFSALALPILLGHIRWRTIQGGMTIVFGVICMSLCMHSWWYSMEYGYFLSRVSKEVSIKRINKWHPSQTYALKRMLHASTMLSVAFLATSILIIIQYAAVIFLDDYVRSGQNIFLQTVWMLLIVVPGIVSLIPVVIMPKLFIIRIHRKWKAMIIKPKEAKLRDALPAEYEEIENLIDTVSNDKLDFHYFEIIGAIITVLLNFGMLLTSILMH